MIHFVTENWLKTNGVITDNVDVTDFAPLVQYAAKAYVKSLIGSYFYEDLLVKYNAQTLSTDEETLVGKMQYAIGWRAVAQSVITLSYQLKNKGIQKQSSDQSEPAELNEVKFMYNHYIDEAKLFELEMQKYLIANESLYPVYLSTDNNDSTIKNTCGTNNNRTSYGESFGMFFI